MDGHQFGGNFVYLISGNGQGEAGPSSEISTPRIVRSLSARPAAGPGRNRDHDNTATTFCGFDSERGPGPLRAPTPRVRNRLGEHLTGPRPARQYQRLGQTRRGARSCIRHRQPRNRHRHRQRQHVHRPGSAAGPLTSSRANTSILPPAPPSRPGARHCLQYRQHASP